MARVLKDDRGQVLVAGAFLVALAALLLVAAVDLGTVHLARARLQAAADAAALAGVQEAEPRFEFEVNPVFVTEFFPNGAQLPPPEAIKSKTPRYVQEQRARSVTVEYTVRGWTRPIQRTTIGFSPPVKDYVAAAYASGRIDPSWEILGWDPDWTTVDVLVGWDVTYVGGYEKRVVDAWVELPGWPARASAEEAMARNARVWRQLDRMEFVGPWVVDDAVNWSKTRVEYVVNRAVMGVRTQILGRLRGGSDYIFVNVRDQAAEAGFR
jgi:hypothetical protein